MTSSEPLVTCCLRVDVPLPEKQLVVEEAIEAFLRQRYERKELLVISGYQRLTYRHPKVLVINLPSDSLETRIMVARTQGRGQLFAQWWTHILFLPDFLATAVAGLGQGQAWATVDSFRENGEYRPVSDPWITVSTGILVRQEFLGQVLPLGSYRCLGRVKCQSVLRWRETTWPPSADLPPGPFQLDPHWNKDYEAIPVREDPVCP